MSEMTLRDQFAAAALQGLLAGRPSPGFADTDDGYAARAFKIADAMLKIKARRDSSQ